MTAGPSVPALPRRRDRWLWAAVALVVAGALAVGGAALGGTLPHRGRRAGPLVGVDGVHASLPVRPSDTGVLWGVLNLENPSGSPIVLDSVEVAENPDRLPLLRPPYVWDEARTDSLGFNGTDGYQLPLPADWHLPPARELAGFTLRPTPPEDAARSGGPRRRVPSAEVLLEFAPARKPTKLNGITVDYHIGATRYRRTFDTSIVLCPIDDMDACRAVAG